jgi:hypothetical protein
MKSKKKQKILAGAEHDRTPPTLTETCCQLEDLFDGVMSGEIDLNKARIDLQIKRVQMKRL